MMAKIDKPGLYSGVPMADYHGDLCVGPSISSSGLRTIFTESPEDYYDTSYLNSDRGEEDDKESFVLGRAAHHLLLGEDDFSTLFIARPDEAPDGRAWNGNNNTCKAWLAGQEKAGRTVLTPGQIEAIRGMARALAKDPLVDSGILNGAIEQTLVYRDKKTGVWVKSRPDAIPNDSGDAADLKTTRASFWGLDRDIGKYRYDVQAAVTRSAFREVLKRELQSFSFVFVKSKRPHSVSVLTLKENDIDEAEKDMRTAIDTFAWCHENQNWFGPSGTQMDARFVHISERVREDAAFRREFLAREIARSQIHNQPTGAEYLAAG